MVVDARELAGVAALLVVVVEDGSSKTGSPPLDEDAEPPTPINADDDGSRL